MSMIAMTEIGRQMIHVLIYSDKQFKVHVGNETLVYEMPEYFLATEEDMLGSGVHGQPIDLGTVELPTNAYISRTSIDLLRPAGFAGSIPGAIDFLDTHLNHMFQVDAGSILDLAADPYHSELLGFKLVTDCRNVH